MRASVWQWVRACILTWFNIKKKNVNKWFTLLRYKSWIAQNKRRDENENVSTIIRNHTLEWLNTAKTSCVRRAWEMRESPPSGLMKKHGYSRCCVRARCRYMLPVYVSPIATSSGTRWRQTNGRYAMILWFKWSIWLRPVMDQQLLSAAEEGDTCMIGKITQKCPDIDVNVKTECYKDSALALACKGN